MGIGHVAVGLALKRADRSLNVGWLIFAALLPDFLLGWFALAGKESYQVPTDFASAHYLLFTFPWSHGLVSDLAWAAVAGLIAWRLAGRRVAAMAVALAVISHYLLDGIVHVRGLPLGIRASPALGLGLWRHMPLELTIEVAMAVSGLWLYRSIRRGRGMTIYIILLTAFLVVGQVLGNEAPARDALIASWIVATPMMAAIAFALDRQAQWMQAAGSVSAWRDRYWPLHTSTILPVTPPFPSSS